MGGQQFGEGTRAPGHAGHDRDREPGRGARHQCHVEAGASWTALIDGLLERQAGQGRQWGIRQKQTGADILTIGGAVASNVHGRGLTSGANRGGHRGVHAGRPCRTVSTTSTGNRIPALFRLVIGGYGLFGVVTSVQLRLARRVSPAQGRSHSSISMSSRAPSRSAIRVGLHVRRLSVLHRRAFPGLPAIGHPVVLPAGTRCHGRAARPTRFDHRRLETPPLPHARRPSRGRPRVYVAHYTATSGQLYWTDLHQRSEYIGGYHPALDRVLRATTPASEIITEIYVPRTALASFMRAARRPSQAGRSSGRVRHHPPGRARHGNSFSRGPGNHGPASSSISTRPTMRMGCCRLRGRSAPSSIWPRARWELLPDLPSFRHARSTGGMSPEHPRVSGREAEHDPEERFQSEWYRHLRRCSRVGSRRSDRVPRATRSGPTRDLSSVSLHLPYIVLGRLGRTIAVPSAVLLVH